MKKSLGKKRNETLGKKEENSREKSGRTFWE